MKTAPTNFAKEIHGEQVHDYESIHIVRLRELALAAGIQERDGWVGKFTGYVCGWSRNVLQEGPETFEFLKRRRCGPNGDALIHVVQGILHSAMRRPEGLL